MKKVLVTGVSGYVGSHIALELLNRGYKVCGTVRSNKYNEELKKGLIKNLGDKSKNIENLSFITIGLLDAQDDWNKALKGYDFVIHSASPFPSNVPKDENELIKPAKEGALNVLRACNKNKIKKVVLTSSVAASVFGQGKVGTFNEEDWTDVTKDDVTAYYKSKTLAEESAWKYAKENNLNLTTILPALVTGPIVYNRTGTSVDLIKRVYEGGFPAFAKVQFEIVDVRDVAKLHVDALENKRSDGNRYLAANGIYSFKNIGQILQSIYKDKKIDKGLMPNWLLKIFALIDPSAKSIIPALDAKLEVDSSKARSHFSWEPISIDVSLRDTVESLKEYNLVKK